QNAPPDGGHDEEDGQGRPHAANARHDGRNARWIAARNLSGTAVVSITFNAYGKRKTNGSSHSSCPRRHQETPALQYRDLGLALAARRPLHPEDRLLQSAAAVGSCRP